MLKQAKSNIVFAVLSLLLLVLLALIGPMNAFQHGYFANEVDVSAIPSDDLIGVYDLTNSEYTTTFVPTKKHMTGVEVYIAKKNSTQGNLILTIEDGNGKVIDRSEAEVSSMKMETWYKFYTKGKYQIGNQYTLHIFASGTNGSITLQKATTAYMTEENKVGEALLNFAYKKATLNHEARILICFMIISLWIILLSTRCTGKKQKTIWLLGIVGALVTLLSWNFIFSSIDGPTTSNTSFQAYNDSLNTGIAEAEKYNDFFVSDDTYQYGLGRYSSINGGYYGMRNPYTNNDEWTEGYSNTESAILVNDSPYIVKISENAKKIRFQNGDTYAIKDIKKIGENYRIDLDGPVLSFSEQGALDYAVFIDAKGSDLPRGYLSPYKQQFGLQGKVFRLVYRILHNGETALHMLKLACSMVTALVFVVISLLIKKKYNAIIAGCFLLTFWLSPWTAMFAQNLYWVEFTWFIPMAVGLYCSLNINELKARCISYVLAFISILIKCLCGYEYISAVMMGLITFLLADLIFAILSKNKEKSILLFRTTFAMGIIALLGFMAAICMHAILRGNGNILEGIITIFKSDVLRRTAGADLNQLSANLWDSMNASIWEVLCRYFHFNTDIIVGVPGKLFQVICIIPLGIFVYDFHNKKLDLIKVALYIVTFFTSISWIVLAKSHSYVHTFLNFILWYFGFIQICIYIICDKFLRVLNSHRVKE
ncbi:hypothetical protein QLX55_07800 [Solobacterium moorei]|uniref:hypothetical protein n=1 Tax=Solobacterium moorei TaxID=102148 RepID=UPI0024AE3468|nr:hypothetical protein [Solobacterium moorei]MDI6415235.1 hypothetical protein [Solobacterium moorei]